MTLAGLAAILEARTGGPGGEIHIRHVAGGWRAEMTGPALHVLVHIQPTPAEALAALLMAEGIGEI